MAEINLLETKNTIASVKQTGKKWLLRLVVVLLFLAMAGYLLIFIMQSSAKNKITNLETKMSQVRTELQNNKERNELITRQGQLQDLNKLLGEHQFWSTLLPELARVSLTSASYTTIETATAGNIILSVAVPTYADAEKFLQVFDLPEYNQQFSNVRLLALSRSQQDNVLKTVMRIQLTLNPNLLKKQIQ